MLQHGNTVKVERKDRRSETVKSFGKSLLSNNTTMKNKLNSDSTESSNNKKFKFPLTASARKFEEEKAILQLMNNKNISNHSNQRLSLNLNQNINPKLVLSNTNSNSNSNSNYNFNLPSNNTKNNNNSRNNNNNRKNFPSKSFIMKPPLGVNLLDMEIKAIEEVNSLRERDKSHLQKSIIQSSINRRDLEDKKVTFKEDLVEYIDISMHKDDNVLDYSKQEDVIKFDKIDKLKSEKFRANSRSSKNSSSSQISVKTKERKKSYSCNCAIF
jgi:hypothetical protein